MRGHEALLIMRSKGYRPDVVWMDVDSQNRLPMTDDWHFESPRHAHLQIQSSDRLSTLDLRCVIGLMVFVDGQDTRRVAATRDACIQAKAERVIAYAPDLLTDTDGHFA